MNRSCNLRFFFKITVTSLPKVFFIAVSGPGWKFPFFESCSGLAFCVIYENLSVFLIAVRWIFNFVIVWNKARLRLEVRQARFSHFRWLVKDINLTVLFCSLGLSALLLSQTTWFWSFHETTSRWALTFSVEKCNFIRCHWKFNNGLRLASNAPKRSNVSSLRSSWTWTSA